MHTQHLFIHPLADFSKKILIFLGKPSILTLGQSSRKADSLLCCKYEHETQAWSITELLSLDPSDQLLHLGVGVGYSEWGRHSHYQSMGNRCGSLDEAGTCWLGHIHAGTIVSLGISICWAWNFGKYKPT